MRMTITIDNANGSFEYYQTETCNHNDLIMRSKTQTVTTTHSKYMPVTFQLDWLTSRFRVH